jgi:hypothetical protein
LQVPYIVGASCVLVVAVACRPTTMLLCVLDPVFKLHGQNILPLLGTAKVCAQPSSLALLCLLVRSVVMLSLLVPLLVPVRAVWTALMLHWTL